MKKSLLRLGLAATLLVAFASCQKFGELTPENFAVNPNPLEVKANKVEGTITANFPEKFMAKKGTIEVTPVLKYKGGEAVSESAFFQGEKVQGNNDVIQYKVGGSATHNFSFNYIPEMKEATLWLRFKATIKDKEIQVPEVQIAVGCITTANLACPAEIEPAFAKDNFMRDTTEITEADIMFQIQRSNVKNNKDVKALNATAQATAKDTLRTIKGLEVVSAASPDGGVKLNEKLAAARQDNTVKFLKRQKNNQAAIDAKYIAQDWEGFQKLVNESSVQDKDLILRVLGTYQDPAQREAEIKNLSAAYTELANDILPKLRRSHLALTVIKAGKTDAQILDLAKNAPAQLNVEELMFASSIAENEADAAQFVAINAEQNAADWRTNNNLAALKFQDKKMEDVKAALAISENAGGADKAEVNFNKALLAMLDKDVQNAEAYLGNAAGVAQLGEAQGVLAIQKGEYAKAVEAFGNTTSNNAALAQLLAGNTDKAAAILDNVANKTAKTFYLAAICDARANDAAGVYANLKEAASKCKKVAAMAASDLEFAKYWLEADFKAAIQ